MKGRHDTQLVYVHDGGEIDVGLVSCVPRKGDTIVLRVDGVVHAHRVEQVDWLVGHDPIGMLEPATCTTARVSLSRCE